VHSTKCFVVVVVVVFRVCGCVYFYDYNALVNSLEIVTCYVHNYVTDFHELMHVILFIECLLY